MTDNQMMTQKEAEERIFQQWQNRLRIASEQTDRHQWMIADLLKEGIDRFGPKAGAAAKDITLFSPQNMKLLAETAAAFPPEKRNRKWRLLTHARIKAIDDQSRQMEFFELAQAEGWDDIQVADEITRNQLVDNRTKVNKELFQLNELFQFGRNFNRFQKHFDTLPQGQKQVAIDEAKALVSKLEKWLHEVQEA
jgi:hypothetical protein